MLRRLIDTLLVCAACTSLATAATPEAPATSPPQRFTPERVEPTDRDAEALRKEVRRQPLDFDQRLDYAHDWLFLGMQTMIENTDRYFARDVDHMLPVPVTPFRLGMETELVNHDGKISIDGDLDLDLILKLPNLEDRLRIFITSDDVEESPSRVGTEDGRVRAGLRFNPLRFFDFDVGVRVDVPPVAFTSLRWARNYELGAWDVYPFSKVYIETKDGFGVAGGVTFDRWLARYLMRSASYVNWRKDEAAAAWTQTLLFARASEIIRFGRYGSLVRGKDLARGWGVQALVEGDRVSQVDAYELAVLFKRPTSHRWLHWQISPLVRWEKEYNWHSDFGIRVGFDALFWDLER